MLLFFSSMNTARFTFKKIFTQLRLLWVSNSSHVSTAVSFDHYLQHRLLNPNVISLVVPWDFPSVFIHKSRGERTIKRRFLRDEKSSNCSRQSLLLGELNLQWSFPQKLSSASKYINSRQLPLREESFLEFQSLILATEVEIKRSATAGKVPATVHTAASSDPFISARCDWICSRKWLIRIWQPRRPIDLLGSDAGCETAMLGGLLPQITDSHEYLS